MFQQQSRFASSFPYSDTRDFGLGFRVLVVAFDGRFRLVAFGFGMLEGRACKIGRPC